MKTSWIPTLLIFPIVYFLGWLLVQPLMLFDDKFIRENISLLVTFTSFILFSLSIPLWSRLRWNDEQYLTAIGLYKANTKIRKFFLFPFLQGYSLSLLLILLVIIPLILSPWGEWLGIVHFADFWNAVSLGFGVAFAEELIFRGWLLCEMHLLVQRRWVSICQAAMFSIVHARLTFGFWESIGLLSGLFLLGLLLSLIRTLHQGSLWGCIGLHGGLVGQWFLLSSGLVEFSSDAPAWLFGPGGQAINPVGGVIGIFFMSVCIILLHQRKALAMAGKPLTGA